MASDTVHAESFQVAFFFFNKLGTHLKDLGIPTDKLRKPALESDGTVLKDRRISLSSRTTRDVCIQLKICRWGTADRARHETGEKEKLCYDLAAFANGR